VAGEAILVYRESGDDRSVLSRMESMVGGQPGAAFIEGHCAGSGPSGSLSERPLSGRHSGLLGDGLGGRHDGRAHESDNWRGSLRRVVEQPRGGVYEDSLCDLPKVKGAAHAPWFETWIRQNLATHDYWERISYQGPEKFSKITVPSLNLTGWFDANFPGSSMNYMGMKKVRRDGRVPKAPPGDRSMDAHH